MTVLPLNNYSLSSSAEITLYQSWIQLVLGRVPSHYARIVNIIRFKAYINSIKSLPELYTQKTGIIPHDVICCVLLLSLAALYFLLLISLGVLSPSGQ